MLRNNILIQLLNEGRAVEIAVAGDSMRPILKNGDIVTLLPLFSFKKPITGKIAMTRCPNGRLRLHRVVSAQNGTVITKPELSQKNDEPVASTGVLGIVTKIHVNPITQCFRWVHKYLFTFLRQFHFFNVR